MLRLENITFSYDGKVNVIDKVSLQLDHGSISGLIGLNGAGKTTLLNVIFGFIDPDEGEVTYSGEEVERKDISFLDQDNFFYSDLTGGEYLNIFPDNEFSSNLKNIVKVFDLPLNEMISNYSSGMKKKLAILAMIKQDKEIMMLDEPFNTLDLESSKVIEIVFRELKNTGKIILISSHVLDPLMNICDSIYLLKSHKISRQYFPQEFSEIKSQLFDGFEERIIQNLKG